jgi:hypothetical protein
MNIRQLLLPLLMTLAPFAAQAVEGNGTWTQINFGIKGTWTLSQEDGRHILTLGEAFKTKKGPDLKLFLSPRPIAKVTNDNAIEGSAFMALLKSHKGGQRYVIPSNIDLSAYKSLVIHCEKYTKVWGGTDLP